MNFVIEEILGRGVAYQARFDPQAKGLGEWLRSRHALADFGDSVKLLHRPPPGADLVGLGLMKKKG